MWTASWDGDGNLVEVVDPVGGRWRGEYDALGRMVAHLDPTGAATRYSFTTYGTLTREEYADGTWTEYEIDGARQLRRVAASDGRTVEMVPGCHRQAAAARMPDGSITRYEYDRENRLIAVINASGAVHRFTYDPNGFMTSETTFDGRTMFYKHGLEGQSVRIEEADGRVTDFVYDTAGQLLARIAPDGEDHHEYDADGMPSRITTSTTAIEWVRDTFGRVVKETTTVDSESFTVEATWDPSNAPARVLTSFGHSREYRYDARGALALIEIDRAHPIRIQTDSRGLAQKVEFPSGGSLSFAHDPLMRLTRSSLFRPVGGMSGPEYVGRQPGLVAETSIHYGVHDEPLSTDDTEAGSWQYQYDGALRLQRVDGPAPENFSYDATGNLFDSVPRNYDAGDVLTSWGNESFIWDAEWMHEHRHAFDETLEKLVVVELLARREADGRTVYRVVST